MFCTTNLEKTVLYDPALREGKGCDHLQIVTGFTDCEMISNHLIGLHDGGSLYSKKIQIDIILGMYRGSGLTLAKHQKIIETLNRINAITPNIQTSCRYVYKEGEVHSKVYSWQRGGEPEAAYAGSANYSINSFRVRREVLVDCSCREASKYYNSLLPDTVDCMDGNVVSLLRLDSLQAKGSPELIHAAETISAFNYENLNYADLMKQTPIDVLKVSWLTDKGQVGTTSGPNWGQRQKPGYYDKNNKWISYNRDPNQAYIPYNKSHQKPGFFPDRIHPEDKNCPLFKAVTKDDGVFFMRMAQDNNKALHSAESNALLGRWVRKILGVPSGAPVRLQDFQRYGKTEITFRKYADDVFVMDF